jgi:membrane fusion protein (multidrug efflux system)
VTVGVRTASRVQILSGLSPGDTVITTGLMQMRPGLRVDVVVN